jgi:hypothetical protein
LTMTYLRPCASEPGSLLDRGRTRVGAVIQSTCLRNETCCASCCFLKIVPTAAVDCDCASVIKQLHPKRNRVNLRVEHQFNETHLINTITRDRRGPKAIHALVTAESPDVQLKYSQLESLAWKHMITHPLTKRHFLFGALPVRSRLGSRDACRPSSDRPCRSMSSLHWRPCRRLHAYCPGIWRQGFDCDRQPYQPSSDQAL